MNKIKTLYVVGNINLPNIDAGASRTLELSKAFKQYFDKIIIAGKHESEPHIFYDFDEKISFLPYHRIQTKNIVDKLNLIFRPTKSIMSDLRKCCENFNITHLLIYSALEAKTAKKITKFAKKHGINIIFDVVEFQKAFNQTIVSYFTFYLHNVYINRHLIKQKHNVISISSFLNSYFLKKGCNSVIIPFVFNTFEISYKKQENDLQYLRLMYAGSPKKGKDLLINCITGLSLLPESLSKRIRFNVAGISKANFIKQHKKMRKTIESLSDVVVFHDHVSRDEINKLYSNSDFSVLIRNENSRLSKAGFPTKVSESLAHGVPVICNITSDLKLYLEDGYNSIIMNDHSPSEFARCVSSALQISSNKLVEMCSNSRKTSEEKLDIKQFDSCIKKVLNLEK